MTDPIPTRPASPLTGATEPLFPRAPTLLLGGLLLASTSLPGCHSVPAVAAHKPTRSGNHFYFRCIDDCVASITSRKVARKHLAMCHTKDTPHPTCDYRRGFEQAYVDVALGSPGTMPVVPPPMYWTAGMRSPEGHARAQDWFQGYCDGVQRAVPLRAETNRVQSFAAPCGEQDPH